MRVFENHTAKSLQNQKHRIPGETILVLSISQRNSLSAHAVLVHHHFQGMVTCELDLLAGQNGVIE